MEHSPAPHASEGGEGASAKGEEGSSPHSSANDDGSSQYSGDESDDNKEVVWDAETEICLFESIAKYPPIGVNRFFSILNSSIYMQKKLNKRITPQQTYEHVKGLYNLEALEDDMELQTTEFTLPPDYAPLIEERERVRKEQKEQEGSTTPPQKKRRTGGEKDKEKEKDKKGKDKEKEKVVKEVVKEEEEEEEKEVESPASSTSPSGTSKYATFSEFIQGALQALGGAADLQTLYNYVAEHSQEVDKKYATRFENGSGKATAGYKSNVRSTLHNNQCFTKLPNGMWTITPPGKKK